MTKVDKILAYEEISREVDFFAGETGEVIDEYKSLIVSVLEHGTDIDAFVKSVQSLKQNIFVGGELDAFREMTRALGDEFVLSHAGDFILWLDQCISIYFQENNIPKPEKLLFSDIEHVTSQNLFDYTAPIGVNYGDTGIIIFFRECIARGLALEELIFYSESAMEKLERDDFHYWEFRNIVKLAGEKKKFDEQVNIYESVNISLSGGNMNGLSHVGVIEGILESGRNISLISGSSMGALIGVIAAKVLDSEKAPEENLEIWRGVQKYFLDGIGQEVLQGYIFSKNSREKMKEFFLGLGKKLGIDENTQFRDLNIPIVVNASRYHDEGEQQVFMSDDDVVIHSMLASVNIYGKYFGRTQIDETPLADHAANKQINPTEALKILGMYGKKTCIVDTGSGSSDMTRDGISERIIRKSYPDTTRRDVMERLTVKLREGTVIAPDLRPVYNMLSTSSAMNIGFYIDPEITKKLMDIGKEEAVKQIAS